MTRQDMIDALYDANERIRTQERYIAQLEEQIRMLEEELKRERARTR